MPHKPQTKLTHRQLAAIDAYFANGFNKAAALLEGGYKASCSQGYTKRFFDMPLVVAEVERRRAKIEKKHDLTNDWIVKRLMRIADAPAILAKFKQVGDDGALFWDFTGATEEELAVVQELMTDIYVEGRGASARAIKKFKVGVADAKAALDSLARIQGMFNDKIKVEGEISLVERLQKGRARVKRGNE
jgi:hypothetical protein